MNKAKEILYKHAKSNGCKSDLLRNPFLEQAVLNAINEALTIPAVIKSVCYKDCGNTQPSGGSDNICLNCGSSIKQTVL